jgi:RimJ/RimL family protein N-acetyltransferase
LRSRPTRASSSGWACSSTSRKGRQAEIGYVVGPAARGRGVGTRTLRLLTDWGFAELGLERLELWIDVTNAGSERVAERAGYVREGVLRSYLVQGGHPPRLRHLVTASRRLVSRAPGRSRPRAGAEPPRP